MTRASFIFTLSVLGFLLWGASYDAKGAEDRPVWWARAEASATQDGYRLISVSELKALYESGKPFDIIDVRPDYEFEAGHLPKACQIEFGLSERSRLDPEKRKRFEASMGHDKNQEIIIYCRNYQ